jgi:septum formation protein
MTAQGLQSSPGDDSLLKPSANLIPGSIDRELVLASTSTTLRRLLEASGLAIRVLPAEHDEFDTMKTVLRAMDEPDPADLAELCMRAKIDSASGRFPGALVVGAYQVISVDGRLRETPYTIDAARDLLLELRGKTHQLHSAVGLAEDGQITWSNVETTHLTMRSLSPKCIGQYLSAAGPQVVGSPGGYQLDGVGLQLFDQVQGSYPAVLGVPLFQLLGRLREIGFMVS